MVVAAWVSNRSVRPAPVGTLVVLLCPSCRPSGWPWFGNDHVNGDEADRPGRQAAGVTDVAVLRDADDPNSVWLIHEGDPALVGPIMSDPERAAKMQQAGLTSPPTVYVAEQHR